MYSQNDEEWHILKAVGDRVGRFLDIGANDGMFCSNTLALVERGWSGVLVEANPETFVRLVARHGANPKLDLVCAAVGTSPNCRLSKFWPARSEDGLSTTEQSWRNRRAEGAGYGEPYHVAVIPLYELLGHFPVPVDVLSIDTEGTSVELFIAYPLSARPFPKVIVVEHDGQFEKCLDKAREFGYQEVARNPENLVLVRRGE